MNQINNMRKRFYLGLVILFIGIGNINEETGENLIA